MSLGISPHRDERAGFRPLRVLVVARWYPAVDDPVRGSFLADQVAALAVTGAVEQRIASFEYVRLNRVPERQPPEREAILRWYRPAIGDRLDTATPGGWLRSGGAWPGAESVPVARLPVAAGPDDPPWREGDDHADALGPFASGPAAWHGRFDLLHAHTGFPDGAAAATEALKSGRPYVVTEHSSLVGELLRDPDVRPRYAAAIAGAARVVVVSATLAAALREGLPELAGHLRDRLVVIPNAVPLERFPAADRSARRRGELLYVGSRKADKGISTLLEAFARVHADRPETTLRLIGRSPTPEDEQRWRDLAGGLGVAGVVAFEPPVDRDGVARAMARADVFVHPSRHETFGVVAVEALAAGLPVVGTRSGGVAEILGSRPEENGALVAIDDPIALADAIVDVLDRRDKFDPLRLRTGIEARFAAPVVAERLVALYREVVAEAGTAAEAGTGRGTAASPPVVVPGPAAQGSPEGPVPLAARVGRETKPGPRVLPILVVGFNRVRAARLLSPLPGELRRRLALVTVPDPGDQPLPEDIGEVLELDLDEDYRAALEAARPAETRRDLVGRALRFARDPGASDRIAGIHARRSELRLETARRRIAEEIRRRSEPAPHLMDLAAPLPDILCLDGYDVRASEIALGVGAARLAPGAIRWLADRWAAG
jgi:glycosyltransferase involved in cell wall biosynthesis